MKKLGLIFYFVMLALYGISQPAQPVMRNDASIAFDSHRGEVIMNGGALHTRNSVKMRDSAIWSWNGARWKTIGTAPSLRGDAIFLFNGDSKKIILYGGRFSYSANKTANYNDTWEFDGSGWKQTVKNAPTSFLAHSAAAYDPIRKRIVLFGGHATEKNIIINETWTYQNGTWTLISPANSPPPRCMHTMFYDAQRKGIVVIGGMNESGSLRDMWIFDEKGWKQLDAQIPFEAIGAHTTVVMDKGEYLSFISSIDQNLSETWLWSNSKWQKLNIDMPSPRTSASLVFDPSRRCAVLFGGSIGMDSLNEVWEFSVVNRSWVKK
jgi:hypothetical protein